MSFPLHLACLIHRCRLYADSIPAKKKEFDNFEVGEVLAQRPWGQVARGKLMQHYFMRYDIPILLLP